MITFYLMDSQKTCDSRPVSIMAVLTNSLVIGLSVHIFEFLSAIIFQGTVLYIRELYFMRFLSLSDR